MHRSSLDFVPISGGATWENSFFTPQLKDKADPTDSSKTAPNLSQEPESSLSSTTSLSTTTSTSDKIKTLYPTLPPPEVPYPKSFDTTELVPLASGSSSNPSSESASSQSALTLTTTLVKVNNEFHQTISRQPTPSAPPRSIDTRENIPPDTSTLLNLSEGKACKFSVKYVVKHLLKCPPVLPDIPQTCQEIDIAQKAVEFALFLQEAQQYVEECLTLKIQLEKLKKKCLYTKTTGKTFVPSYVKTKSSELTNKQNTDVDFYKKYGDRFMIYFKNDDPPCVLFRSTLRTGVNLNSSYTPTIKGVFFDFSITEFIRYSQEKDIPTDPDAIIKTLEEEAIVNHVVLNLHKYLLLLFAKRLEFAKIEREMAFTTPTRVLKSLLALQRQIRVIKPEKEKYVQIYITEIFPYYNTEKIENSLCENYITTINSTFEKLEKDTADALFKLESSSSCCIIA